MTNKPNAEDSESVVLISDYQTESCLQDFKLIQSDSETVALMESQVVIAILYDLKTGAKSHIHHLKYRHLYLLLV